jgi:hypothetical protein
VDPDEYLSEHCVRKQKIYEDHVEEPFRRLLHSTSITPEQVWAVLLRKKGVYGQMSKLVHPLPTRSAEGRLVLGGFQPVLNMAVLVQTSAGIRFLFTHDQKRALSVMARAQFVDHQMVHLCNLDDGVIVV